MSTWSPTPPAPAPGHPSAPTFPPEAPEASPRSQVAVYAVCAMAILITGTASDAAEWGVVGALVLGLAIVVSIVADLKEPFGSLSGIVAAAIVGVVAGVVLALLESVGVTVPLAIIPVAALFALGLDWRLVNRLRPLPFIFGLLVVVALPSPHTWTFAAGLIWLALAFAALASLEIDRRVGQPQVAAVNGSPSTPPVRTDDLVSTVLIALAIGLVAALVLSTPSCQRRDQQHQGSSQQQGGERGQGGQGQGQGQGSGTRYVPDPDGRYLIPQDGSGSGSDPGVRIPSPEELPERGDAMDQTTRIDPDGTRTTFGRDPDGTPRVTVDEPGQPTRVYRYTENLDGTTRIDQYDANGDYQRSYTYDPNGQLATDDSATSSGGQAQQQDQQDEQDDTNPKINWRILLAIVLGLLAIAALVTWLVRRTPKPPPPDAPPWALHLVQRIEHEGRKRGAARSRSETLVAYTRRLASEPWPDPRLEVLGTVVSDALFGRSGAGPETQRWAESTFDEVVEAHPAPGAIARRRAGSGAGTA